MALAGEENRAAGASLCDLLASAIRAIHFDVASLDTFQNACVHGGVVPGEVDGKAGGDASGSEVGGGDGGCDEIHD